MVLLLYLELPKLEWAFLSDCDTVEYLLDLSNFDDAIDRLVGAVANDFFEIFEDLTE